MPPSAACCFSRAPLKYLHCLKPLPQYYRAQRSQHLMQIAPTCATKVMLVLRTTGEQVLLPVRRGLMFQAATATSRVQARNAIITQGIEIMSLMCKVYEAVNTTASVTARKKVRCREILLRSRNISGRSKRELARSSPRSHFDVHCCGAQRSRVMHAQAL